MNIDRREFARLVSMVLCGLSVTAGARTSLAGQDTDIGLTLIVPFPPGAGSDAMARLMGTVLRDAGKLNVLVNNVSGGNGVIAANRLLNSSSPDGVAMFSSTSLLTFVPALSPGTLNFDPEKRLIPIATVGIQRYVLVAAGSFDPASLLNRNPRAGTASPFARIGAVGSASVMHFHSQALARVLRKELDIIPYRGMADLMQAMLSGQIDLALVDELTAQRLQASGRVRLVAAMSAEPCILFPSLPRWRQSGFAALDMDILFVVYAGSGMSEVRMNQLAEKMRALGGIPAFHDGMRKLGVSPLVLAGGDARRYLRESVARDRRYIEEFGNERR